MKSNKQTIDLLRDIVELMRKHEYKLSSPYGVQNFMEDHVFSHEELFLTGCFDEMIDDEDVLEDLKEKREKIYGKGKDETAS